MKLQQVVATSNQKVFKLKLNDNTTTFLFSDTQQSNEFSKSKKYNKNSLKSTSTSDSILSSALIHNMYPSKDPFYKSAIYKLSKTKRTGTSTDFQNITQHQLSAELISMVQIDNNIYMLEPESNIGHSPLTIDTNFWLTAPYTSTKLNEHPIKTFTYDRDYIKECLEKNDKIDSDKCIKDTCLSVLYNMLYELDGNIYSDYESSVINANVIKCKNQYNDKYSMEHNTANFIINGRKYTEIGKCNGILYMKYNCSLNDSGTAYSIPNIEVVNSINRFVNFQAHKSNVFSILLTTDVFSRIDQIENLQIDKEILKKNIKQQIINNTKTLLNKIMPVNSLLFKIYFNEIEYSAQ